MSTDFNKIQFMSHNRNIDVIIIVKEWCFVIRKIDNMLCIMAYLKLF